MYKRKMLRKKKLSNFSSQREQQTRGGRLAVTSEGWLETGLFLKGRGRTSSDKEKQLDVLEKPP